LLFWCFKKSPGRGKALRDNGKNGDSALGSGKNVGPIPGNQSFWDEAFSGLKWVIGIQNPSLREVHGSWGKSVGSNGGSFKRLLRMNLS
jgi:hypothetical protein